ncbi:ATP-grasp domain-containing protein [Streptomyces bambusae]|uniref:ATP-grasp domain-containing protein n=1 Tax=Streptomyces bambusae TaxID=1550616 RepID=A0ABS6ZAR4_9ACTN|nr:ATP-grasp domain-containing protein [Streptomyces bambusae]MBW5484681.1 ATP-grasp domain-containing protein [Streptomyces bambusae]
MSVLVLHQIGSVHALPYARWFDGYDGDVVLLTCAQNLAGVAEELPGPAEGYAHAEAVEGYDLSGTLEARALDLARRYDVRHLVSVHERDLDRAAALREILGLPGQRPGTVLPFRDKLRTKEYVEAAGLRTAPHREIHTATDLLGFAEDHGFPVVLKPRDSAGSMGLRILHTPAELDAYLAEDFDLYGADQPNVFAEAYVEGPMCHVDGLVVDGRTVLAWPSQYQYALASYATDTGPRMDLTLDVDDPLARRLLDLVERILDALPGPADFAFHAEVFHTPDDELVLCEIACRTGGAAIRDIVGLLFGVDPTEAWLRAQLGLPLPGQLSAATPGRRLLPRRMSGQMVLMKRPGTVVSVPQQAPDFPWIEKFRMFVEPGQTMGPARHSSDFMFTALVSGRDRTEVVARLKQLESWFLGELVLEEA